jgi:hypothetical protein
MTVDIPTLYEVVANFRRPGVRFPDHCHPRKAIRE